MASGLYLHIGHQKTGSSYIQSSLAGSIDILARHGIHYPVTDSTLKARDGFVSAGNAPDLLPGFVDTGKLPSPPPSDASLLFSGEHIFNWLQTPDFQDKLLRHLREFEGLNVLLFIRDPVAHACSRYQQFVKNGGLYKSLDEFFDEYNYVRSANAVLDFLESIPLCEVTVRNYSALNAVLPPFETWLSLPGGSLAIPPKTIVNRSLTASEMEIQRLFNAEFGVSGHLFAGHLVKKLPHIPSDDIRPALAVQERLWDRLAPEIERMNARVEPKDRYVRERDVVEPEQRGDTFVLHREQLELIYALLKAQTKTVARLKKEIVFHQKYPLAHALATQTMHSLQAQLDAIRSSTSWRITAPLRGMTERVRRIFRGQA